MQVNTISFFVFKQIMPSKKHSYQHSHVLKGISWWFRGVLHNQKTKSSNRL
uniref:Uncharacterized protein n=1 Tax=Helianthus annuus TaxID=4232 RepID=A0A251VR23_HELAN